MPKTFKHSGDLGDIIFSLPTIRAAGGGILYLDPEGGLSSPLVKWWDRTRTRLNAAAIDSIRPLLLQQPYLSDVRYWRGEPVDCDLDLFRRNIRFNNLSDSHLAILNLPSSERDRAWLTVNDPIKIPDHPFIIYRSVRGHGNGSFWDETLMKIKNCCVFVGYPKEHEIFVYTFEVQVPYYPTPDILALARVIAGAERFICNQGLPHALAEGMKKNLINEVDRTYPAAVFKREDARYV